MKRKNKEAKPRRKKRRKMTIKWKRKIIATGQNIQQETHKRARTMGNVSENIRTMNCSNKE